MTTQQASMVALLALTTAFGGCRSESKGATDTNSNWLSECEDDGACGAGLQCLCGVCSRPCENSGACAEFGDEAACVEVADCREMAICGLAGDTPTNGSPSEAEPEQEPSPSEAGVAPLEGEGSGGDNAGAAGAGPSSSPTSTPDAGSPGSGGLGGASASNAGAGGVEGAGVGGGGAGGSGLGGRGGGNGTGGNGVVGGGGAGGSGPLGDGGALGFAGNSTGGTMNGGASGQAQAGSSSGGAPSSSCTAGEFADIGSSQCQCVEDDLWSCSSYVSSCAAPSGSALDVVVRTEYGSSPFSCFGEASPARPIHNEEDLQAALCGTPYTPSGVNWDERMMYAAVVQEGQELDLLYAVQSNGVVHLGVQGSCAITGAAPGHGVMLVELDVVSAVFMQEICGCPFDPGPEPEPLPP